MKYELTHILDATGYETVEADSPEEAIDKYEFWPQICHQCNSVIEVGEIISTLVCDESGEEVHKVPTYSEETIKRLKEKLEKVENLLQSYLDANTEDDRDRFKIEVAEHFDIDLEAR